MTLGDSPSWFLRINTEHVPKGEKGGQFAKKVGFATGALNSLKPDENAEQMTKSAMAWRARAGMDSSDAPPHEEMVANWKRASRGKLSKDKVARQQVNDAMAENDANPLWRDVVAANEPDYVLVTVPAEPGGRITLVDTAEGNAQRVAGTTVLPETAVAEVMGPQGGRKKPPEKMATASSYGLASMIRHEYGHSIDHMIQERDPAAWRDIMDSIPDKQDLSYYAYWHASHGNNGEVIPELLALVTHPDYREEDFPKVAPAGRKLLSALGVQR